MKRFFLAAVAFLFASSSTGQADPVGNNGISPQRPDIGYTRFASTYTATTSQIIFPGDPNAGLGGYLRGLGQANGAKCWALISDNNDPTLTHAVTIRLRSGGSVTGTIAAGSSTITAGISSATLTPSVFATLNPYSQALSGFGLMTVSAVSGSIIVPGELLSGSGVPSGEMVMFQVAGSPGGAGVYVVSIPATVSTGTSVTGSYGVVTVSAVAAFSSGGLTLGQVITGSGVAANTFINAMAIGTVGGIGTYYVSPNTVVGSPTTLTAGGGGLTFGRMTFTTNVNAGTIAGAPVQALTGTASNAGLWPGLPSDNNGNQYVYVPPLWTLEALMGDAPTSSDNVDVLGTCAWL